MLTTGRPGRERGDAPVGNQQYVAFPPKKCKQPRTPPPWLAGWLALCRMFRTVVIMHESGRREHRTENGFTLIELMVVLAIASILAAFVGIGVRLLIGDASTASATGSIAEVQAAEAAFANGFGVYTPYPGDLQGIPNGTTVTSGVSTGPSSVSIAVGTDGTLALTAQSKSGVCVAEQVTSESVGGSENSISLPTGTTCTAANALPSGVSPEPVVSQRPPG